MKKNLLLLFVMMVMTPWMVMAQVITSPAIGNPNADENGNVWYYIQYVNGKLQIHNTGEGANLIIKDVIDPSSQLWKFEKVNGEDGYKITGKSGSTMYFTDNRLTTSSSNYSLIDIIDYSGGYELKRVGAGSAYNPDGGNSTGKELGEWGNDHENNKINFILSTSLNAPELNKNYYIRNLRTGWTLTSTGTGGQAKQSAISLTETETQQFQLIGSYTEGFRIVCQDGELKKSSLFDIMEGTGDLFKLVISPKNTYGELKFGLQTSGSNGINMDNNKPHEVCEWSLNDDGSVFDFVTTEQIFAGLPEFSTSASPKWYYINVVRQGTVFDGKDYANDTKVKQGIITFDDSQLFRFEGDFNGFRIICKTGGEIKYGTDRFILDETGSNFIFETFGSEELGANNWLLKDFNIGKYIVDYWGQGIEFADWTDPKDTGSALRFVSSEYAPELPNINEEMTISSELLPYFQDNDFSSVKKLTINGVTPIGYLLILKDILGNNQFISSVNFEKIFYHYQAGAYRQNHFKNVNPNCLKYITSFSQDEYITSDWTNNVLTTGSTTAISKITLDESKPFDFPTSITLSDAGASYIRNAYIDGGWETIILPFEAIKPANYTVEDLSEETESYIRFTELEEGTAMVANKAYIMKYTGTAGSPNEKASLTINSVSGATWEMNPSTDKFRGTYAEIDLGTTTIGTHIYLLNANGDAFGPAATDATIPAFRAYLDSEIDRSEPQRAKFAIIHGDGDTTGMEIEEAANMTYAVGDKIYIKTDKAGVTDVYAVDGTKVCSVQIEAGTNVIENLTKGIYIINKQKVVLY